MSGNYRSKSVLGGEKKEFQSFLREENARKHREDPPSLPDSNAEKSAGKRTYRVNGKSHKDLLEKTIEAEIEQNRKFDEINKKIEAVLSSFGSGAAKSHQSLHSESSVSSLRPSTGKTVNLTKAYDKVRDVRETTNAELEAIHQKKKILEDELKTLKESHIPGRRHSSQESLESDGYATLLQCKKIVDCLFDRELNNMTRSSPLINFEAGDGAPEILFSRDISASCSKCNISEDLKAQRKDLIDQIYSLTQTLKELECQEKF